MKVHLDFESYSEAPLSGVASVGAYAYARHPATEVICAAHSIDDEDPWLWLPDVKPPVWLQYINDPDFTIYAHNSFFELVVWTFCLQDLWGPPPSIDKWHDTAALAATLDLPRSLSEAGKAAGLPADQAKDKRGKQLIQKLCKPQKDGERCRDPELLEELYAYCKQDVVAERALSKRLLPLTPTERQVWILDQKINLRGLPVDVETVDHALYILDQETDRILERVRELTGGRLKNLNRSLAVLEYFAELLGHELPSFDKHYLGSLLEKDSTPELAKELIRLRLQSGKISTKKYVKLKELSQYDGRMHGVIMYHGAHTGRWAGRHFAQNPPRPAFKDTEACVELYAKRDRDLIEFMYDDVMTALSSTIRGMVRAKPGNRLIVSDYSAIEARVLPWLAKEETVLDVFRGDGKIYEFEAARIYNVKLEDIEEDSDERKVGKTAVLGLGYQGGYKAFVTMGTTLGFDIEPVAERATVAQRREMENTKEWFFENREDDDGDPIVLSDGEAFAEIIKRQWRDANSNIVRFWEEVQDAAFYAVENPGSVVTVCDRLKFKKVKDFLFIRLPSGRRLSYAHPKIGKNKWNQPALDYTGTDDKGNWVRRQTYGGKMVENITQAVARDVLAEASLRAEDAGYPIVYLLHDEPVAEVPIGYGSLEEYERLLCVPPTWADGLPLAVSGGYEAERYRK